MSKEELAEVYAFENQEWLNSLDYLLENESPERVREVLQKLQKKAAASGVSVSEDINTPYINTISPEDEEAYPGDLEIEEKLTNFIRWNALAMVVRANKQSSGIGGHISTYASSSTLFEVGFHHFFKGLDNSNEADLIYFQGHATPGIYARSFLEGRLTEKNLDYFRRELSDKAGLSSYPHPRLMPEYWRFPTVSMGLGAIQAIYQARFIKYLEDRKLKEPSDQKVWSFLGDGEMDEPESIGALPIASRENLDNLIFVVSCNLQRLDGPVRGNYKVIQELEGIFKGSGWNVIKVVWGDKWDPLLKKDKSGKLVERMNETVDGQYQLYSMQDGAFVRDDFFGKDEVLQQLVEDMSDEEINQLNRGGHDPKKVFNAYKRAVEHTGQPTVILAQTVKGYGLGKSGEASNVAHQRKKLDEKELKAYRDRFDLPIADDKLSEASYYRPKENSKEIKYLLERRKNLGGLIPKRKSKLKPLKAADDKAFKTYREGAGDREASTTMVMVQMLAKLMKDKNVGKLIVPIVPDESRTFGMDALFRQFGIYSHIGQRYEPVDKGSLMFYKEAKDGAILEEGITEAGSISSFIAAGTAYANLQIHTIPFYFFYSMFGFQRTGDFIWAAADARARGFLIGGTAGRTTLPGEGLQHQDGNSHILALPIPNLKAYDPTFAYELAVIIKEGMRRMYQEQEDIFYYITVTNDNYKMPPMPKGVEEGILQGMYRYQSSEKDSKKKVHLLGSGAILQESIKAAALLEKDYGVSANVWSVTSYKALYDDAIAVDRYNRLHPDDEKNNYIQQCMGEEEGVFVAATDYLKALPATVAQWFPQPLICLGTDGFGRSDNRPELRDFFEVDHRHIALAALSGLLKEGKIRKNSYEKAMKELKIHPDKVNPTAY
ncbi:pyruvate dehydrogenase (acetyl-transferring), homodimeric type [Catalinimonas niigatensis]|uniref:pyruvate dehydrogenase (acetyl-transferring), homodimeric type n=1 Tax=Catalinimonas niigatensis TaxID=1397264 RepID=UPI002665AC0F|nr:pyruvate dehydrogenase (acetyl-transferring), homodimeric type [Catalinimonas niigatensis]WPP51075.1 pyruvate dehydrogenase (acetyl-transferring), homodimeric type [Catalinimonas niigatensis]